MASVSQPISSISTKVSHVLARRIIVQARSMSNCQRGGGGWEGTRCQPAGHSLT